MCNEPVCRLRDAQREADPCNNHDGSYKKWEIIRLFRVEFPPVSGTLFAASMKTGHFTVLGIADPIHVLWFSARERQLLAWCGRPRPTSTAGAAENQRRKAQSKSRAKSPESCHEGKFVAQLQHEVCNERCLLHTCKGQPRAARRAVGIQVRCTPLILAKLLSRRS